MGRKWHQSHVVLVFIRVSVFRQYPGSECFGDGFGSPGAYFLYSSTTIWGLLAKQQGHQIAIAITTCTRTDEEPCIPGPLCSRTHTALFGTLLPTGSSNFGGPPAQIAYLSYPLKSKSKSSGRKLKKSGKFQS